MFGIVFVCVVKLEDRPSVRLEFRVCVCACKDACVGVRACTCCERKKDEESGVEELVLVGLLPTQRSDQQQLTGKNKLIKKAHVGSTKGLKASQKWADRKPQVQPNQSHLGKN